MTVINRIKEFVDSRGMTVYQFWKAASSAGGLTEPTAYRLYKDPFAIPSGKVMDSIYKAFPEVNPGDLLAFIPDEEAEKLRNHMEKSKSNRPHRRDAL
mgnify:CR=1 FL=1